MLIGGEQIQKYRNECKNIFPEAKRTIIESKKKEFHFFPQTLSIPEKITLVILIIENSIDSKMKRKDKPTEKNHSTKTNRISFFFFYSSFFCPFRMYNCNYTDTN